MPLNNVGDATTVLMKASISSANYLNENPTSNMKSREVIDQKNDEIFSLEHTLDSMKHRNDSLTTEIKNDSITYSQYALNLSKEGVYTAIGAGILLPFLYQIGRAHV